MNQELQFNEKVFQITSSQFSYVIMAYEIESRRLRFLNQSALTKNVPRIIEDAPQNLLKYIPQTKDTKQQVRNNFPKHGKWKTESGVLCFYYCAGRRAYVSGSGNRSDG